MALDTVSCDGGSAAGWIGVGFGSPAAEFPNISSIRNDECPELDDDEDGYIDAKSAVTVCGPNWCNIVNFVIITSKALITCKLAIQSKTVCDVLL